MRNGQNKRMRNRNSHSHSSSNNNNRRGQNPMTRVYESNGPEIKIRGTASHLAEKYVQLARDAQGSGDPVAAENYYQHAEHYFRIIAAAQEQFRQNQPQQYQQRPDGEVRDDAEDSDGEYSSFGAEPGFAPQPQQQPQPQYQPREPQPYQQREQQFRENRPQPQPQPQVQPNDGDIDRLPSFITGGQPQPAVGAPETGERADRGDRFQHRRRRRHHSGPRPEGGGTLPPGDGFGPGQAGD